VRFEPADWAAVYESSRPTGQQFAFRRGAEMARDRVLARSRPGEHWVDVGSGTGHLAAELAAAGLRVSAIDSDPEMVRAARERFPEHASSFATGAADELPFADRSVDGVVATSLVGLLGDPRPFMIEAHRVLSPGGRAVITFTNAASSLHAIGAQIRTRGPDRPTRRLAARARRYSRAEAIAELERAGMSVVETLLYNPYVAPAGRMWPPRGMAVRLERRLQRRAGELLARNVLVVAERPGE
jgi:ubiquinone/menaquinone biosynthesis C-methylase UbiE